MLVRQFTNFTGLCPGDVQLESRSDDRYIS
jgi:hypothetical protein